MEWLGNLAVGGDRAAAVGHGVGNYCPVSGQLWNRAVAQSRDQYLERGRGTPSKNILQTFFVEKASSLIRLLFLEEGRAVLPGI